MAKVVPGEGEGSSRSSTPYDPNAGAGVFVLIVWGAFAAWIVWSFATGLLVPALALAKTLAQDVIHGMPGGLVSLAIDLIWGIGAGLFVGWLRWRRQKRLKAVEAVVDSVANPEVVSAASLGTRYVFIHAGAGLAAGLVVGLLGLAFPSQVLGDGTNVTPVGIAWLHKAGLFGGSGGGGAGGADGPELLLVALVFFLLFVMPLLCGLTSAAVAVGVKKAASGAAGAAGKNVGLVLFLVLTQLRERASFPTPPVPEPRPQPKADSDPFDLDRIVADFVGAAPERRDAVGSYMTWLRDQGIEPNAQSIEENAPRYKNVIVDKLARRMNNEVTRRRDHRLEYWHESTAKAQAFYEQRLEEVMFGPGWWKRALRQGLWAGAATGVVTALLVGAALALLGGG